MNLKKGDIIKIKRGTIQEFLNSGLSPNFNDDELFVVDKIEVNGTHHTYVIVEELPWLMDWQVEKVTNRETLLYYTYGRKALIEEFVEEIK